MTHAQAGSGAGRVKASAGRAEAALSELAWWKCFSFSTSHLKLLALLAGLNQLELVRCSISIQNTSYKFIICRSLTNDSPGLYDENYMPSTEPCRWRLLPIDAR